MSTSDSLITSRSEFHTALRSALAEAAAVGCRELWLCDNDFADWPLGERQLVDSLSQWAGSHRRLTLIAHSFDEVARRHARWNEWRRQWSHIVHCRSNAELESGQMPCVLLASGLLHLPPKIPQVEPCLGTSMFFCKDCDGVRSLGKKIVIVGNNDEAVEYALGLFSYASCVFIATNGQPARWSRRHAGWIREYKVPVRTSRIVVVEHARGHLKCLSFENDESIAVEALFTTRGDVIHNKVAKSLGAKLDLMDQVMVDKFMRTSVPGLYAAGCVTPANCQMIIAAGDGAKAAQAINRDLFIESLRRHTLHRLRDVQLATKRTKPVSKNSGKASE